MSKNLRILKPSPPGKLPRARVRKALSAIHVFPSSDGGHWEVKEIGRFGKHRKFISKKSAMKFAKDFALQKHSDTILHEKHARLKVTKPEDDAVHEVVFDKL